MRKAMVLGVLSVAGTLASPAFADEFSGFRLQATMAQERLEGDFQYDPVGVDTVSVNRLGYSFGLGWALNKYLAIEGNFRGGGDFNEKLFPDFVDSIQAPPAVPGAEDTPAFFTVRNDLMGLEASAVGSLWIGNKFSVFGRAGFFVWKAETSYSFGDQNAPPIMKDNADDNGFAPLFGLGVQTTLDGALVRLEYQFADVGDLTNGSNFGQQDNTVSSLNVSIVWIL